MVVVLILVGIVAVAAAAVRLALRSIGRPHLWPAGLLIVCAPLEVYRGDIGPGNLSVFRVAVAVAVLALIPDLRRRPPKPGDLPLAALAYAALVLLQIVSVVFVTDAETLGSKFLLQYLVGLAAAAVLVRCVRADDLRAVAGVFVAALAVPALASVYRVLAPVADDGSHTLPGLAHLPLDSSIEAARTQGSFLLGGVQRFQGTFSDPNHFAFFVGVGTTILLGLLVALLVRRDRTLALAVTMSAAAAVVLLIGSYSRSAWLLTAVAVVVWAVLAGRRAVLPLLTRRRVVGLIGAAVIAGAVVTPAVADRLDPETAGTAISTEEHGRTMRLAIDLATSHPLAGVGLGGYGAYAGQPPLVSSSHSTLLTTAAELGLPGLLLLLTVIGTTVTFGVRAVIAEADVERVAILATFVAAYLGIALANIAYEVWADDFQWVLFGALLALTAHPSLRDAATGLGRVRSRRRQVVELGH